MSLFSLAPNLPTDRTVIIAPREEIINQTEEIINPTEEIFVQQDGPLRIETDIFRGSESVIYAPQQVLEEVVYTPQQNYCYLPGDTTYYPQECPIQQSVQYCPSPAIPIVITTSYNWPLIILAIVVGIILVYIAIVPGLSTNQRWFGLISLFIWGLIWFLILYIVWQYHYYAIAWYLLLIIMVGIVLVFIIAILLNLGSM